MKMSQMEVCHSLQLLLMEVQTQTWCRWEKVGKNTVSENEIAMVKIHPWSSRVCEQKMNGSHRP